MAPYVQRRQIISKPFKVDRYVISLGGGMFCVLVLLGSCGDGQSVVTRETADKDISDTERALPQAAGPAAP